jgi:membrane-associated phospholipid phosphatase
VVGAVAALALRFRELQAFTFAWLLAAFATIVILAVFPSLGAFHHYGIVEEMQRILPIQSGYIHLPQIEAVRAGVHYNPYSAPVGLVTFPSFHAAGGVMLAWLFWQIPYLRWPMLALNLAMIAATPLMGAHYFADIIGGIIIAGLSGPKSQTP